MAQARAGVSPTLHILMPLAGMNSADGEFLAFPVASRAGFAKRRRLEEGVRCGILTIVAAQTRRSGWPQRRVELARSCCIRHAGGQRQLVGVAYVALGAVAPVAR